MMSLKMNSGETKPKWSLNQIGREQELQCIRDLVMKVEILQEHLVIWEDHPMECHLKECLHQDIPWDLVDPVDQEGQEDQADPPEECHQVECPLA